MSVIVESEASMTLDEFEALVDDPAVDRELLDGRLVERPMTWRNRWHSEVEANVAAVLRQWVRGTSPRAGKVYCGEVGCRLPVVNSGVGIDVAFFSMETVESQPENRAVLVGPPVLAVEILSHESVQDLYEKISLYLRAGVKLVWLIDPRFRTLTVHRSDAKPKMYVEGGNVLRGEPFLNGFELEVSSLFD